MQKLKNSIIDNMIKARLTGKEIDFMIYVSRYQDTMGKVCGVHYKTLCSEMGMSYQEFYNAKNALQEKGFIRCEKSNRIDHDITIIGNTDQDCRNSGYINTNHNIFFEKAFFKLKAGAKLLALFLMKVTRAGKGHFEIYVKNFYDTEKEGGYPERFGVTERILRAYLMSLKEFFSIGIKDRKYYITPKKNLYRKTGEESENRRYKEYHVDVILRRMRATSMDTVARNEICSYFDQYKRRIMALGRTVFTEIERAVIQSLAPDALREEKGFLKVNHKFVHKLLKENVAKMEMGIC